MGLGVCLSALLGQGGNDAINSEPHLLLAGYSLKLRRYSSASLLVVASRYATTAVCLPCYRFRGSGSKAQVGSANSNDAEARTTCSCSGGRRANRGNWGKQDWITGIAFGNSGHASLASGSMRRRYSISGTETTQRLITIFRPCAVLLESIMSARGLSINTYFIVDSYLVIKTILSGIPRQVWVLPQIRYFRVEYSRGKILYIPYYSTLPLGRSVNQGTQYRGRSKRARAGMRLRRRRRVQPPSPRHCAMHQSR